ncbi:MAG TPA: BREX-1 system phosphatase PglZ type B [Desulfobulbaceae bacterium]|nr:BREX-1 system phosphatase PglZ type B [Desulfobulbaceae bacterium]
MPLHGKETIGSSLIRSIQAAAMFNPEVQVAPACILWPDSDRQWEPVIQVLQVEMPELFVFGEYVPEKQTGPAIWLRCILAGRIEDVALPQGRIPIFYLPGVSRQDLRAVESCPGHLKPLAELQYRGVIWSQINAKDWTILAFLKSDQGGLGLDIAQSSDAKNAMQLALGRLIDEELALLKGKRLDTDYFNTLLTGGDPIRDLLQWLDQGDAFRAGRGENEWKAFIEVCKSQLAFNPQNEGILSGAAKLAVHEGPWQAVWARFCEAPKRYPNIPALIRKCRAPSDTLFWHMGNGAFDGWPQWNEDQEKGLHRELIALSKVPPHEARVKLKELEKRHAGRRSLVWAELGESPLAFAVEHLAAIAELTTNALAAGTVDDLASGYSTYGWKIDDGVLNALAFVGKPSDLEAVATAIRSTYLPWAEESARYLQRVAEQNSYPGGTIASKKNEPYEKGECLLFVDGLRFDLGKRLAEMLIKADYFVTERSLWMPLPSVTATGKPAAAPLLDTCKTAEETAGYNFEPITAYLFRKTLEEKGWKILERSGNGDGQGNAWCEFGDIDHEGHDRGWKIAKHLDGLLAEICDRIKSLLAAGWSSVRVVTDHGWLLMPGGLPKIELPAFLVDSKWGRCALLKSGAESKDRLYPWYWNPDQYVALADGISCYKAGEEYAHGGLSLQECLTLQLSVRSGASTTLSDSAEITDVVWKGLRCTVAVDGNFTRLSLDVRTQAGNAASSVVVGIKPLKDNGTASVVVENEEMEGRDAAVVLLDSHGALVAETATVIGGGNDD